MIPKDTHESQTILVTGPTGRQGGAVIRSLSTRGWKLRALVRDPAKPEAQQLAKNNVELVQGNLCPDHLYSRSSKQDLLDTVPPH